MEWFKNNESDFKNKYLTPLCSSELKENEYSAGRKNVMTWKKIDHGNKFVACSMEARAGAP